MDELGKVQWMYGCVDGVRRTGGDQYLHGWVGIWVNRCADGCGWSGWVCRGCDGLEKSRVDGWVDG